jgi:pyruvate dehydrogenase E1 component alpha subunit
VKVKKDELPKILFNMMRVRRMEELCAELYTQQKIRGFLHLYIGEEAIVAGVMSLLRPQDNVMATYREHGHALLKGVAAKYIMAEMMGKSSGVSRGRGGSMHLFSVEHRFFGGNAIVAAGIPQATGLGLASKKLKENRFTVCFFGEGAMAEGVFYESLNMAGLWEVPIIFCCENNLYAMGTSLERSQVQTDLVKKVESHKIAAQSVDGMNIFDVLTKTKQALDYVKENSRPYFLEFKTYRFRAHSMFDPELYRSKEEVLSWREKDPIDFLKNYLLKNNLINQRNLEGMKREIESEMLEAISFAESSPLEPIADIERYLYANDL